MLEIRDNGEPVRGTGNVPVRPVHHWRVTLTRIIGSMLQTTVDVSGDALQVEPCGALTVLGPVPYRRVLQAWASGAWVSVEACEDPMSRRVTDAMNAVAP